MAVQLDAKDRRAMLWGHAVFFVIGTSVTPVLVYYVAASPDIVSFFGRLVVDPDEQDGPRRQIVSAVVSTLFFLGVFLVLLSHWIEAVNRVQSVYRLLLLLAATALEAWVGTFLGTAAAHSANRSTTGWPKPDAGVIKLMLNVTACVVFSILASLGVLRGGYGGGSPLAQLRVMASKARVGVSDEQ